MIKKKERIIILEDVLFIINQHAKGISGNIEPYYKRYVELCGEFVKELIEKRDETPDFDRDNE